MSSSFWLVNADKLRFDFASTDVDNSNNVKTADGTAIVEMLYDIPDADTVIAIAEKYGLEKKHTDDGKAYYAFPLTWSDAIGEHGETANQCGSYKDGESIEIPLTLVDGNICVIVPDTTTTTVVTTTTTATTETLSLIHISEPTRH